MCMLCVEIAKDKMTPKEIARAYTEFTPPKEEGPDHWVVILEEIFKTGKFHEMQEELFKVISERYGDE